MHNRLDFERLHLQYEEGRQHFGMIIVPQKNASDRPDSTQTAYPTPGIMQIYLDGHGGNRCNIRVEPTDLSRAEDPYSGFLLKKYPHQCIDR